MNTPHTPLPWFADGSSIRVSSTALGKSYKYPVMLFVAGADPLSERHAEANAAFIVRAVNNHDELVATLEACVRAMDDVKGHLKAYQAVNQFHALDHVQTCSEQLLSRLSA